MTAAVQPEGGMPRPGAPMPAVVIGGSAGALEVVGEILTALAPAFSWPLVVVLHLSRHRPSLLPAVLAARSTRPVVEPDDKEPVRAGNVYVAPPDYHLLIDQGPAFALSTEAPVKFARPSIDALFESAADVYGPNLVGVVLTGANDDGARGLRAITQAGGCGIVQAPASAVAPTMPNAALALCAQARVLTQSEICGYLLKLERSFAECR